MKATKRVKINYIHKKRGAIAIGIQVEGGREVSALGKSKLWFQDEGQRKPVKRKLVIQKALE